MDNITQYVIFGAMILFFAYAKGWIFANFTSISAQEAIEKISNEKDIIILDVRTKGEYDSSHLKNSTFITLFELSNNFDKLDKNKTILVYCHSGTRSISACRKLSKNGFNVINISGGIVALEKNGAKTIK
jgi:rhodanese-related sulfurtransferase